MNRPSTAGPAGRPGEPRKRVWILGAGFSYPLGAPLFGGLFSNAYTILSDSARMRFNDKNGEDNRRRRFFRAVASHVYRQGAKSDFWGDPEQFLQRCCDALDIGKESVFWDWLWNKGSEGVEFVGLSEDPMIDAFQNKVRKDQPDFYLSSMLDSAREEVAVEVSTFLMGERFEGERWLPYKEWLKGLTGFDTILTFNYDQAIEMLWGEIRPFALNCPKPGTDGVRAERHRPTIFKLHGSAGWKVKKSEAHGGVIDLAQTEVEDCDELLDFLNDFSYRPFIFTPGPEKHGLSSQGSYWNVAMNELREAEEIHVIGYRFPDTDTFAQQQLLDAMADNSTCFWVNIVLGPDVNNPQARRCARLIGSRGLEARTLELYSQDYLIPAVKGLF